MHNGHALDMQRTRNRNVPAEWMSNVHPTDEYRLKQTPEGSVPDKTDEQDIQKN